MTQVPPYATELAFSFARLWAKIEKTETCWNWIGYLSPKGYGRFNVNGKNKYAYRVTYEWIKGPIPDGLELDHLCRNRACVNPDHLEPVTHKENQSRGIHATKTHCKWGHEFTEKNTYMRKRGKNWTRVCRICNKASKRKA